MHCCLKNCRVLRFVFAVTCFSVSSLSEGGRVRQATGERGVWNFILSSSPCEEVGIKANVVI